MKDPSLSLLNEILAHNLYLRMPNMTRRKELGSGKYKKGYEVRFVVRTADQLEALRHLLKEAGFSPAKPFQKAKQLVQPVYGKETVEYFLRFRQAPPTARE